MNTVYTLRHQCCKIPSHLYLGLSSRFFPSGLPTRIVYVFLISPKCVTCLVYLTPPPPDLITTTILWEECESWSFSLCRFLKRPPAMFRFFFSSKRHYKARCNWSNVELLDNEAFRKKRGTCVDSDVHIRTRNVNGSKLPRARHSDQLS
jgi:hypothetical protein